MDFWKWDYDYARAICMMEESENDDQILKDVWALSDQNESAFVVRQTWLMRGREFSEVDEADLIRCEWQS